MSRCEPIERFRVGPLGSTLGLREALRRTIKPTHFAYILISISGPESFHSGFRERRCSSGADESLHDKQASDKT